MTDRPTRAPVEPPRPVGARPRIAVLGVGRMGELHARNVVARVPELELVAVADADGARAKHVAAGLGVAAHDDWHDLLERRDVDAVLVATPAAQHPEQVAAAARAGKHVFCEKPLGVDLDEVAAAVTAAEAAGVVLHVGFNRRYDRNFGALQREVATGRVGTPWLAKITARDPALQAEEYLRTCGGLFLDMTIHDLDLALFLAGSDIEEVSVAAAALTDPVVERLGDVDTAVTTLRFASGALGVIDNCRVCAYGYDQRAEVHGSLGRAVAENEQASTVVVADATGQHAPTIPYFLLERYADAYVAELAGFAAALRGEPTPAADGRSAWLATAAALAAARSATQRRTVSLAELPGRRP